MARGKKHSPERVVNLLRQLCGEPCATGAWAQRAACVPSGETDTRHAALSADTARRRRYAHPGHRDLSQSVWPLWLPPDYSSAALCRLACRQGPGGTNLASRGAKGSTEAEAKRPVMAQRRVMRATAAGAAQPCLELRLRECEDLRRKDGADAKPDR